MAVCFVTLITLVLCIGTHLTQVIAQPDSCISDIQTAEINDTLLHYIECGVGEPLVFVHGAFGDLHSFRDQVEPFAREFRIIAYSRRYHPPNDPPQSGDIWTIQLHAADLAAIINELGAGPAHIIAHSGGAYIALVFTIEYSELVRSLVLGEAPVLPLLSKTTVGDALRDSWNKRVLDPVRYAFENGTLEEGVRQFFDGIQHSGWLDQIPSEVREYLVEKQGPTFRLYMLTEPSQTLPHIPCDTIAQIEHPALLVTGEESPAMFHLVSAELERCLSRVSHVMIPYAGHGLQSNNPELFNESVLDFLRRH